MLVYVVKVGGTLSGHAASVQDTLNEETLLEPLNKENYKRNFNKLLRLEQEARAAELHRL